MKKFTLIALTLLLAGCSSLVDPYAVAQVTEEYKITQILDKNVALIARQCSLTSCDGKEVLLLNTAGRRFNVGDTVKVDNPTATDTYTKIGADGKKISMEVYQIN